MIKVVSVPKQDEQNETFSYQTKVIVRIAYHFKPVLLKYFHIVQQHFAENISSFYDFLKSFLMI